MSMFLFSPNPDVLDGAQEKVYAFGKKKSYPCDSYVSVTPDENHSCKLRPGKRASSVFLGTPLIFHVR